MEGWNTLLFWLLWRQPTSGGEASDFTVGLVLTQSGLVFTSLPPFYIWENRGSGVEVALDCTAVTTDPESSPPDSQASAHVVQGESWVVSEGCGVLMWCMFALSPGSWGLVGGREAACGFLRLPGVPWNHVELCVHFTNVC